MNQDTTSQQLKLMADKIEKITGMSVKRDLTPMDYLNIIQNFYENIIANAPEHVYWKDAEGRYLGCNDNMARNAGFASREAVVGMTDIDIAKKLGWPIELGRRFQEEDADVIKTKKPKNNMAYPIPPNALGQEQYLLGHKVPLKNSQGEIIGVMGISVDITQQRELEKQIIDAAVKEKEELNRQQHYYENIIAKMPGHVYWKDLEGQYLGGNINMAKTVNFSSPNDLKGKTDYDFIPKEDADKVRETDLRIMRTGIPEIIEEIVTLDNKKAIFLSKKEPFYDNQGKIIGLLGISFDTTQQKELEEQAQDIIVKEKEQEERIRQQDYYENILANTPGHVYWKDKEGRYLGCNNNMAKILGFSSPGDLKGKTNYDFSSKKMADKIRETDSRIMRTDIAETTEEIAILKGNKKAIFLSKKEPLHDNQGKIIGLLGVSLDITQRKELEKQVMEAAVKEKEQEEQIRTMRIFAGGIAHELRTPLSAIVGAGSGIVKFMPRLVEGYTLAKNANLDVPLIRNDHLEILKETAEHIVHEGEYSLSIITMMLVTAQNANIDDKKFTNLSMVNSISEALKTFSFQNPDDQALVHFKPENDFQFWGDPTLTIHIIFNLLKNAIFFIHKGQKGEITIWLENQKDKNILYFKDTGTGIPKENMARIFEGYFTTRDNGTGVGLPLVMRIMHSFKGEITCDSVEGEYTMFILTFPLLKD
ncbi:MAG: hypothetical protein A3C55_02855 [Gammaproteobacteria bacterium RIFCSPHIGHO2_02_FULL_42_13]|nr:MAG: hypothetical protein A3C55_02855 [Gammaproteobacteria bacterium RIFCSPHIGHO2_02_FULL_42_13]OGT68162.1 MAG: hypothetical protein A3H43_02490 [Gammaproteobacteria bacterium RIFCSPLOWO2_02_FULL_42_9]